MHAVPKEPLAQLAPASTAGYCRAVSQCESAIIDWQSMKAHEGGGTEGQRGTEGDTLAPACAR